MIDVAVNVLIDGSRMELCGITGFALADDSGVHSASEQEFLHFLREHCNGQLEKSSSKAHSLYLKSMMSSFVYVYLQNGILLFSTNMKCIIRIVERPAIDADSLLMMLEVGFVIPPYTLVRDIYRLWPQSTVSITGRGNDLCVSIESRWWDIVDEPLVDYADAQERLCALLCEDMSKAEYTGSNKTNAFTVSGGIDSSLLLTLGTKVFNPDELVAITVRSPGQEHEFSRARRVVSEVGIKQHIILESDHIPKTTIEEYVKSFGEPVYDLVVPAQAAVVRAAQEATGSHEIRIFEGQCADSLFLGLPHNMMIDWYLRTNLVSKYLANFSASFIGKIQVKKSSRIGRTAYRIKKALHILGQKSTEEAFMVSLGLTGAFRESSDEYYQRMIRAFRCIMENTRSVQRAIAYFFLYRIIPVREMQKYRLPIRDGVEFRFPYIGEAIIAFVNAIPDAYMINNGARKKILFDVASQILPSGVFTKSTSPFYIDITDYALKEDRDLAKSIPLLREVGPREDRILDYEVYRAARNQLALFHSVYF